MRERALPSAQKWALWQGVVTVPSVGRSVGRSLCLAGVISVQQWRLVYTALGSLQSDVGERHGLSQVRHSFALMSRDHEEHLAAHVLVSDDLPLTQQSR